MAYSLFLEHEGTPLYPVVQEGVSLALERKGAPGTLKFTVLADESLDFEEGDRVHLSVDGIDMFYGYVFAKKSVSDGLISVTAYDQLRYKPSGHLPQKVLYTVRLTCFLPFLTCILTCISKKLSGKLGQLAPTFPSEGYLPAKQKSPKS